MIIKTKIGILVIASLIAIVVLSSIQYYLIQNTFKLEKKAFIEEVKNELKFIDDDEHIETWDDMYKKEMVTLLFEYKAEKITKKELLNQFQIKSDSLNETFLNYYKSKMSHKNIPYQIGIQEEMSELFLVRNGAMDTIFKTKDNGILLFGESLSKTNRININIGTWETESGSKDEVSDEYLPEDHIALKMKTNRFMEVAEWNAIVLRRMGMLLALAIGSIFTVCILFIYAVRLYIKQKKIADIKTDFINNITHEFNTPLAVLNIATKTLQNKKLLAGSDSYLTTVETIDRQNKRLQRLLHQVMNNAIGVTAKDLNKEEVEVNALISNIIEDFKLKANGATLNTDFSIGKNVLAIDKFHFNTAITNIIDNAVKYGGTVIELKTENVGKYYQIIIRDNGIGISATAQKKIFEKFYRVPTGARHDVKGLGLGLYYVKQIIMAHEGSISIKSKENEGTTISIKLPI